MFVAFLQSLSKGSEAEVRDQIVDILVFGTRTKATCSTRLDRTFAGKAANGQVRRRRKKKKA